MPISLALTIKYLFGNMSPNNSVNLSGNFGKRLEKRVKTQQQRRKTDEQQGKMLGQRGIIGKLLGKTREQLRKTEKHRGKTLGKRGKTHEQRRKMRGKP